MIYSLQDETNSEYKHLVNSRFELFRKQDTKIKFCQDQGCIGWGGGGLGGAQPPPLLKFYGKLGGGAQSPLLLHKIAYNVNVCQLCDHKF